MRHCDGQGFSRQHIFLDVVVYILVVSLVWQNAYNKLGLSNVYISAEVLHIVFSRSGGFDWNSKTESSQLYSGTIQCSHNRHNTMSTPKGAFIIYGRGGGGGGVVGKIDRQKKAAPPLTSTRGKNRLPPMTLLENFVLKTCLYVAIVLPQQL